MFFRLGKARLGSFLFHKKKISFLRKKKLFFSREKKLFLFRDKKSFFLRKKKLFFLVFLAQPSTRLG